ncbi:8-amino-7-oxononanoate synthase [Shewanella submarina]|uniref:8-amino-7-oxononanoate synthase n=1 Tax=Shewanella submarina TaxID=2016376 RepID=A0ABV7G9X9_9GAMM|nr:8-amino-7-oxononanoate synthase [Shewanella submarina]MCL1039694.1 8-amino-7-oxononanoate synthase [Shewanella submarina]
MNPLESKLSAELEALKSRGLLRQRRIHCETLIDFAGNDYLGLAAVNAGGQSDNKTPVGSGASPLVSGYSTQHQELERALCQRTGHEAALLFCSGFSANQALMTSLFNAQDRVLADKLVHASIIDGLRQSGSDFRRFRHNDLASARTLAVKQSPLALITESVFSMDGDCAPLTELKALCDQHNAWLIVDDAHGFGVPKGAQADCNSKLADVQLVTFGKALGCQGAALLGSQLFVDYMVATCRHYIYSTSLSPQAAVTALTALKKTDEPQLGNKLADNIASFTRLAAELSLPLMASSTPIQPLLVGDNHRVLELAELLKQSGFLVGAIRPPTVPAGSARLRITLSAHHTDEQISALTATLSRLINPLNRA